MDATFDRRSGIGASEAAAVLGINPHVSPLAIWREKTGRAKGFEGNAYTRLGTTMEPIVADMYAETANVLLAGVATTRHPTAPLFATPDRLIIGSRPLRLVEIKCIFSPRAAREYGEPEHGEMPARVATQAIMQMACMAAAHGDPVESVDIAALVLGDLRIYRVLRDEDREARIIERLSAWWREHVEADRPPEMDGSKDAADLLRSLYPTNTRGMLAASGPAEYRIVSDVLAAKANLDAATEDFDAAKHRACAAIADAEGIAADGIGRITWRKSKASTTVDWEGIARALHPSDDLIYAHTRTKEGSRRFLVTPEGGER